MVSSPEDTYRTISDPSTGIFRDRGSKFLAYAFPLASEEDLKPLLESVRAEHPKARHHCWAYRLAADGSVFRLNDDGEPGGSAGRPILNTILSLELTHVLVIVVRYFGGTLLGVPGLIRAYKTATREALENAVHVEKTIAEVYALTFDYPFMNTVMRIVKEERLVLQQQTFEHRCHITFEVPPGQAVQVLSRFNEFGLDAPKYLRTQ